MGIIIIGSSLISYALGAYYAVDPTTIILIVIILAAVLFIITYSITRTLEGLAEANRLKSEFIGVVSHQLRAPLSNLKWVNEFLKSGRLGKVEEKQAEYFKILEENTNRMEELISDLLTVSKIERGKLPLHKTEFSLLNLTQQIISEFKVLAQTSNAEIKLEVPQTLPQSFADPDQIKLVIENLLDNAIRYIKDKGEVKITIETKDRQLLFRIKDNGVGIPKKDQKYIFQRFFRSRNILKYQTQGSGLGLYIAKSIVERSGGKIGFTSKENIGSTFWFTLPIK